MKRALLQLLTGTFVLPLALCTRSPSELPPRVEPKEEPKVLPPVSASAPDPSAATSAQTVVPFFQGDRAQGDKPMPKDPGAATSGGEPACPRDPQPERKFPTVPLKVAGVPDTSVEAEFALSPEDSERGLMFRTQMAPNAGMLFKLKTKVQTFWMHNTCLSLDMLFLDESGAIVGFLERVPTLNDEVRSIGKATPYVLELNAGYIAKHGLKVGQKWVLPPEVKRAIPPN
jgi:uncharacterized protein